MAKKYRYIMIGMFSGTDGNTYDIEVPSPFLRNTEEEAKKDGSFGYRFTWEDTEPCIIGYADENCRRSTDKNGKKCLEVWVEGDVLGLCTFSIFKELGGKIRKLKDSAKDKVCLEDDDFEETDKTFADIFPNMEHDKLYYIDDEAYYIAEINDYDYQPWNLGGDCGCENKVSITFIY